MPIDVPFTELNRVMELQLKGKTFPETGNAPGQVTVLASSIAAAGDRLLISLRVKAKETKSWFGLGAEATVHVWGKPVLDQQNQIMRLTDITLDVQSEAAFGLLGTAARAAIPYLQKALADNAVVDLKPFAASALKSIDASIHRFQKPADGVEVEASVTELAPHRHRVRFDDLARDRRGRRHRARAGAQDRAAINSTFINRRARGIRTDVRNQSAIATLSAIASVRARGSNGRMNTSRPGLNTHSRIFEITNDQPETTCP